MRAESPAIAAARAAGDLTGSGTLEDPYHVRLGAGEEPEPNLVDLAPAPKLVHLPVDLAYKVHAVQSSLRYHSEIRRFRTIGQPEALEQIEVEDIIERARIFEAYFREGQ